MDYKDGLHLLPFHMRDGVVRYIEYGIAGGSFMTAVFENNLLQGFNRADDANTAAMTDWARFLYNYAPSDCHGSCTKVYTWIKNGGLKGLEAKQNEEQT